MLEKWSQRAVWIASLFLGMVVSYNVARFVLARYTAGKNAVVAGPVHDFGDIFWGDVKEHVFQVRNTTSSPMTIDRVVAECGCTAVTEQVQGKTIEPREAVEMPVRLAVGTMEGAFAKRIVVFFANNHPAPLALTLKGNAKPRVSCSPSQVTFDGISANQTVCRTITVTPTVGAPPLEVTAAVTNTPFLEAHVEKSRNQERESTPGWILKVSTVPPLPVGRLNSYVFLRTSDPFLPTIALEAVVIVRGTDR